MLAALFFCFALLSFGQAPPGQQPAATPQAGASPSASPGRLGLRASNAAPQERPSPSPEEPPVVTKHEIRVGGRTLRYTATTGMMPIKNRDGETEARLFFMAYTLDDRWQSRATAADFFFQWRARFFVGLAAPRHGRSEARADELRRRDARAAV